jgi:hypothetical protein
MGQIAMRKASKIRLSSAAVVVTTVLIGLYLASGAILRVGATNPSAPQFVPLNPPVHLLGSSNASALGIPLQRLGYNGTGTKVGPQTNAAGIPIITTDNGHVKLVVYRGVLTNGSVVIVASVTNVGNQNVMIGDMELFGVNHLAPLSGGMDVQIVGCTKNYTVSQPEVRVSPNGTSITTNAIATVNCGVVAATGPVTLLPGATFSGYVVDKNFLAGTVRLTDFAAGLGYSMQGADSYYSLQTR